MGKGVGDGSSVSIGANVGPVFAAEVSGLLATVAVDLISTRAKAGGSVGTAVGGSTHCTGLASVAVGAGAVSVIDAAASTAVLDCIAAVLV